MHSDDAPRREALLNDLECATVVRMVKNRHDDGRVSDVEIGVTRGQARMPIADVAGHWELQHIQPKRNEAVIVLLQDFVVRVGRIVFECAQHGVFVDEAGDIVDVAVGVVAGYTFSKPENSLNVQILA